MPRSRRRRGDRVAIWSTNNCEWVVAQFATARIGAILVNVNPAYRTHELEYVLEESRARALIPIESFKSSNYREMFYEVCPEAKDSEPGDIQPWRFPHLRSVIFIGREQHLDIDDIINIQYTSGTTGFPKGVLLTGAEWRTAGRRGHGW